MVPFLYLLKGGEFKNMAMIYDLDNEYGGVILSDSGSPGPALRVNSNTAAQPAIAVSSTASGVAVQIDGLSGGAALDVTQAATDYAAVRARSGATIGQGLIVGRSVVAAATIAALHVNHPSTASAPVLSFGGGFISVTSVLGIGATGAALGFDYVLPVVINGVQRGIPLTSLASLVGAAAF